MKVSIDTKEDSHEEIKKVIRMLQNLVGESLEIFSNEPIQSESAKPESSGDLGDEGAAFANILADAPSSPQIPKASSLQQPDDEPTHQAKAALQQKSEEKEELSGSAEDLFAELFSEEELKKMDVDKSKNDEEDDEEEIKPKEKRYDIELY